MSTATPRMRMFAGPNGSGKNTIKGVIEPELLGVAEITGGNDLEMKTDTMPHWFKMALWDKFATEEGFAIE